MQVVIDTNVVLSALYRPASVPGHVLRLGATEELLLYAPASVRQEIVRGLGKFPQTPPGDREAVAADLPITWVGEVEYAPLLPDAAAAVRDPSDAPLVALAVLIGAGIVSGDRAFHPLQVALVPTWTPRALLDHLERSGE